MLKVAILATRGIQIIFSAAVLGLSITLAKGQVLGHIPTTYSYSAFLGAFGMIAGFFGVLCVFLHIFDHTVINLAVDGVTTLLFIAGGAALAIQLKGGCKNLESMLNNKLLNCGAVESTIDGQQWWNGLCGVDGKVTQDDLFVKEFEKLRQRCEEGSADYALMFATVIVTVVAVSLMFVWRRKGRGGYVI